MRDVVVVRARQRTEVVQREADGAEERGPAQGEIGGERLVVAPRAGQERRDPLGEASGLVGPSRPLDREGVVGAHRSAAEEIAAASEASEVVRS